MVGIYSCILNRYLQQPAQIWNYGENQLHIHIWGTDPSNEGKNKKNNKTVKSYKIYYTHKEFVLM